MQNCHQNLKLPAQNILIQNKNCDSWCEIGEFNIRPFRFQTFLQRIFFVQKCFYLKKTEKIKAQLQIE